MQRASYTDAEGETLDDGLAVAFRAPASYTGEDLVELQAHGSPIVLTMLLERCLELGARIARPGEFSERGFLNGKLDLVQAEAVADLIASVSKSMARAALRSLKGEFSRLVANLDREVTAVRVEIEASIDFADEAESFEEAGQIEKRLEAASMSVTDVLKSAERGAALSERPRIVLAGAPNVGKSSLLNSLAGHDRAIVSPEPGTTRDILHEHIVLAGLQVELVDTAGLRPTDNTVEAEGVSRARNAISEADLRIDLWDGGRAETRGVWPLSEPGQVVIEVMNKQDLVPEGTGIPANSLAISLKTGAGLCELHAEIERCLATGHAEATFLARVRHVQALKRCQEALHAAIKQHRAHNALELVAEELRTAHNALAEIVGETTTEDLLTEIFRSFCLGK